MNETETSAELIDPILRAAGWGIVEGSRCRMEFPICFSSFVFRGAFSSVMISLIYH